MIKTRLIRSNEAQASAVALMLACLSLVVILAIVANDYVPVWMKENEALHASAVEQSFAKLKSTIDTQIAKNNTTTCSTPITLGCEGVFMFNPGSRGTLCIEPYGSSVEIYNDSKDLYIKSSGNILFKSQNNYHVRQDFAYECGALFVDQTGGEFVLSQPSLTITNTTSGVKISITLISLSSGSNLSIAGRGLKSISTQLLFSGNTTYTLKGENLTINVISKYSYGWYKYFNTTFKKADVTLASPPSTFSSLEEVRTRLQWIKTDIDSNTPAQIQSSAASPIKDAIDEIIDEVNDAIEARDKGEEDNLISAKQDAIVHCDDALDDINDYWSKGEITDSYRNNLVTWVEQVKDWLDGGGLGISTQGVVIKTPNVIELTVTYAVIEVKLAG